MQDMLEKLGLDIPHPAPDSKEQWEEAYLCSFSPQHQSPPLPLQKKDYLPLKRCFHSFQELERKTSRAGFECMCCPQKDCPVFIGVERLTHYYPYSTNPNMVFPMYHERCKGSSRNVNAVNSSKSACPPAKRIFYRCYFHCQRNLCKVFQWADAPPTDHNKNMWDKIQNPPLKPDGHAPPRRFYDPMWKDISLNTEFVVWQNTDDQFSS